MQTSTCQSCRFYLPQSEDQGLCRRSPPATHIHPNGPTFSVFPPMRTDGWCGEHAKKEPTQ